MTAASDILVEPFGVVEGTPVQLYTLRDGRGVEARICNYGGTVVSLHVPDRSGRPGDVVLGHDTLEEYRTGSSPYFGCLIGRYANRIARGRFTLGGATYTLATNDGLNHLHGGRRGFDKVVWEARPRPGGELGPALELRYSSRDGEEGYPGNLSVTAVYTLAGSALRLDYTATTDAVTAVNLTQHSYFNLAGQGDVLEHEVMIAASAFTPVDRTLIPTGELRPVAGTPFDFNAPATIGARLDGADEQLRFCRGYDHNWVIRKPPGELGLMARVREPTTGRVLEVLSTEPGLQFYSGNFLEGTLRGKGGWRYGPRHGFCLEPQRFPDSPNQPGFPPAALEPGQVYRHTILHRFSVDTK